MRAGRGRHPDHPGHPGHLPQQEARGIAESLTTQKARAGIAAARSSTAQRAEIIPQVNDKQEDLPSACDGWRVIDVVAHLAVLASEAVET
jgi:hypothetical protein